MRLRFARRSGGLLAAVVAVLVAVCVGVLLVERSSESVVERSFLEQLDGSVRLVAGHLRGRLEDLAAALRAAAIGCGGRDGDGQCPAHLDRLRRDEPFLLAAAMAFGRDGSLRFTTPPREWRADERAVFEDAGRRAQGGSGGAALVISDGPGPKGTMYIITPAVGETGGETGAVGVAIDLERLGTMLLEGLVVGDRGVAFLAAADGRLLLASGWDRSQEAVSLGEVLGSQWADVVRRPSTTPGASRWRVQLPASGGRSRLVGVSESIKAAGGEFVLGALVPADWAVRGVRPVLFGGTLLLVGLLAATVTAAAAWRRARVAQSGVEREAERWRGLAEGRHREERWRALADHSPTPIVCLVGTRVAAANLAAADRLAGGERGRLVGEDFLDFVAEADRSLLRRHLDEQHSGGAAGPSAVVRLRPEGGSEAVARMTTTAAREADVTSVYLTWEEVDPGRDFEVVLATLADAIPLSVVLVDPSGNLKWANAAAGERAGGRLRGLRGRPLLDLVEPKHRRVAIAAMARARRGRAAGGQVRLSGPDGETVPAEFRAVPVRSRGVVSGVLFVVSEILTPPARPDEFPGAARERALSHLATSLAHRVSNNFQALLGLLDEIEGGRPPERSTGLARGLVTASVEDLRRFVAVSRSGAGAVRPVKLGPLLVRWLEKARPRLPGTVRVTLRREAEEDRVVANSSQLLLWLDVTLSSALSAMELGGAVELALRPGRGTGTVTISFSDTGTHGDAALDSGVRRDLFSSRRAAQAVAELIAAQLGGRTGGSFQPGLGGRSWLELPCAPPERPAAAAPPVQARGGAVLLADDEEMVRIPLATALRGAGWEVVEAANGLEVVTEVAAAPDRFALVVLDLVMPVMDGREALRRLRASAPSLPVVVCTGYDATGDDVLAAADLLIKPFSIEEFLAKVGELTGRPAEGGNGGSMRQ